jgi:hypothetical protein
MKTRFSKSAGCFYPYSEAYKNVPGDVVVVPIEDYEAAMARLPGEELDVVDGRVVVVPKPAPSLNELKAARLVGISNACEQEIAALQAGYPASEVLSWAKQEAEARSYVTDPSAATPLLDALAEARGIDKAELSRRVILKADAFAQYSGATIGKRQALEDALNALPADATVEQIAAIVW